mmetsp:Transcript_9866/g.16644  ORF Transcript_9866/g.16644 Transcript_9866/m.16644 type:complete len:95 (+) Transcript_9866:1365-1649(+)
MQRQVHAAVSVVIGLSCATRFAWKCTCLSILHGTVAAPSALGSIYRVRGKDWLQCSSQKWQVVVHWRGDLCATLTGLVFQVVSEVGMGCITVQL